MIAAGSGFVSMIPQRGIESAGGKILVRVVLPCLCVDNGGRVQVLFPDAPARPKLRPLREQGRGRASAMKGEGGGDAVTVRPQLPCRSRRLPA